MLCGDMYVVALHSQPAGLAPTHPTPACPALPRRQHLWGRSHPGVLPS